MASIKKTLSKKVDEIGQAQVLFYIQVGRSLRLRIKSGVNVPSQYWNEKNQRISIPQKIGQAIKEELKQIQEKLDTSLTRTLKLIDIYEEDATKERIEHALFLLKDFDGTITADIVKSAEEAEKEAQRVAQKKTVFDITEDYIMSKDYSEPRIKMCHVLFRSMARYQVFRNKVKNKPFTWCVDDVTRTDVEDFFDFMANEHIYRQKYKKIFDKEILIYNEVHKEKCKHKTIKYEARGNNTLIDFQKRFKTFWKWMLKNEITSNNAILGIETETEKYGTPYFLTIEERNIMAEHDFSDNKHLETQRDIFLFQCLVGCRVYDLTRLTSDNVSKGVLQYVPHKTKDNSESFPARIPLSKAAQALIRKYKGIDTKGRLFPFISDQKYNDAIKEVLRACKIERLVPVRSAKTGENEMKPICDVASSHMGRRTFVGNAYKKVKDPNIVGRMSGHVEGSRAFSRYRNIDDDMLKEVITAIE